MIRSVDPSKINGGDWEVFETTPEYRRSRLWISETQYIQKTEYLANDELLAWNKQQYDDSHGRRWGDGKIAAHIPLNVFYSPEHQLAEKLKEGDRDHAKWWLNSEKGRPFRSFKGTV